MYATAAEIEALFNMEAESGRLEFKAGRALQELTSDQRREFVKDVTAFANAAGGTMIIGVSETRAGQRSVAIAFDPVTNQRITAEQLTNIVKSSTDPVFSDFCVTSIEVLGGRVFVVEINQADTAHQNRLDFRYYQRTGPLSEPMYDFAIRDVMNRRKTPRLRVDLVIHTIEKGRDLHRYNIVPALTNEGILTVHHWCLHLSVPAKIGVLTHPANYNVIPGPDFRHANTDYTPFEYSSERLLGIGNSLRLLPGQQMAMSASAGFSQLDLLVDAGRFHDSLKRTEPPLRWALFVDDAAKKEGELPFGEWCRF